MVSNSERPHVEVTKPYKTIIYEKKPPIAYITLNRPEKMNAVNPQMRQELRDVLGEAGWNDKSINVIVIKGSGRCFCAGWDLVETTADIPQHLTKDAAERYWHAKVTHQLLWEVMWDNPKPIITQVHGFCLTAGMAFTSVCDLCIASEDALFGYPIVRVAGPFLAAVSPYILGMKKCRELLYTGNLIDAQEAWRLGQVNKVVARDKLEEEVNKLARSIAKIDPVIQRYSKKAVNMVYELMNWRIANERGDDYLILPRLCAPESIPFSTEYRKIQAQKGLKAALDYCGARFAEEDAWWKDHMSRPPTRKK